MFKDLIQLNPNKIDMDAITKIDFEDQRLDIDNIIYKIPRSSVDLSIFKCKLSLILQLNVNHEKGFAQYKMVHTNGKYLFCKTSRSYTQPTKKVYIEFDNINTFNINYNTIISPHMNESDFNEFKMNLYISTQYDKLSITPKLINSVLEDYTYFKDIL